MPQMMPLYWLMLMLTFITVFFVFNNLNYFNFFYNIKMKDMFKVKLNYNWKW